MSMETRLFNHGDSTYLFTRKTGTVLGSPNSYDANLRRVESDGSVSEPLITKKRDSSTITRKNSCYRGVSSEINPWSFEITDGDKLTLSGRLDGGKVEAVDELKIPVDRYGRISGDSLENLSPIAKRWLRKVGEFLAKVK